MIPGRPPVAGRIIIINYSDILSSIHWNVSTVSTNVLVT